MTAGSSPRFRPFLSFRLLGLFAAACATIPALAIAATGPAVAGFEAYDRAVPAFLTKWQVPGAALAVAYEGRIVFARGYGLADRDTGRPVQPDTTFRIMSCSKMVTAATVLKLVDQGQISLEDHPFGILNYPVPSYAGARLDPRLMDITLAQLLSHTAGWVPSQANDPLIGGRGFYPNLDQLRIARAMGNPPPGTAETLVRYMVGQPLQANPGTVFEYSNQDFLTLGRIIEIKTGTTYEQAVQRILADSYVSNFTIGGSRANELSADEAIYYDYPQAPLGESQFTGLSEPKPYAYSLAAWDAAGGWKTSAIEMLRFMIALDGANGVPALLKPESVAAMRTTRYPSSYYGFGWYTTGAAYSGTDAGHAGGSWGSKTWAIRSADGKWLTVLFLNSLPADGFSGSSFEAEGCALLHARPAGFVPAENHDFTWTTLGWDAWQHYYFGSHAEAELYDTDNDGVTNLIEYSAGLDPTEVDTFEPATLGLRADGTPVFTWRRIVLEHALTWKVSASADGHTWYDVSTPPSASGPHLDGTLTESLPLPGAQFARLHVKRVASGTEAVYQVAFEPRPVFTLQPDSTATMAGNAVVFHAFASGTPAPTYQWQRSSGVNGAWADLGEGYGYSGTHSTALSLAATTVAMNGTRLRCIATNSAGSDTSETAVLTVSPAALPVFSVHPASQTVTVGSSVTFTCAASGAPLTYQWQKDGADITGATQASFTVPSASTTDAGAYSVVATNIVGSVSSNRATLVVGSAAAPQSGGSGGGGGAISPWSFALLGLLAGIRALRSWKRRPKA